MEDGPDPRLAAEAVSLAQRWVAESAEAEIDPAAERLAGVLKDPNGLPFTIGFVDGVMRPESLSAAASHLQRVAPLVPGFLPWHLRSAVRVGGAVAPVLPSPVVPIARRVLRGMVGHLVVDARPDKLGPAIATLRESGARLNLNLLGEAVLGEQEALRRLEGIHELIRRPDVDYVSVKVSAIVSHISMWAFDEVVEKVVERLRPLYLTAATDGTFINLDMEEYRDLDLTIAVFTRLLEDPRLRRLEAGIVLQAYLPDALPALERLTAWARQRVAAGGARIKVRLVKGANLAMERVDAVMHDWSLATYDQKVDSDANYIRCLRYALRPEHTAAVRIGVAGHNLFDIAYAWLLARSRSVGTASGASPDVEFEMLLGMAQGQVQAVAREVGHVLLYVPVVRPDEFDVAISYLVRRLEENASSDNFLSAAFDLADDPAMFARERDRFLASLARADDPGLAAGPHRSQDRDAEASALTEAGGTGSTGRGESPRAQARLRRAAAASDEAGLTQAVIGIARSAVPGDTAPLERAVPEQVFGAEAFVETAVFAPREGGDAGRRRAGVPQHRRQRSGPAGQPQLGTRHPVAHRDLTRRRRDHRGRARHRRARAAGDRGGRAIGRTRVGRPARRRSRRRPHRRGEGPRGSPRGAHRGRGLRDRQGLRRGGRRGERGRRLRQLLRRHGTRARPRERCGVRAGATDRRDPAVELPDRDPGGRGARRARRRVGRRVQARTPGAALRRRRGRGAVGGRRPAGCARPGRHRRGRSGADPPVASRRRPRHPHRRVGDGGAVPILAARPAAARRDQWQERHDHHADRRPRPRGIRSDQERVRSRRTEVLGGVARDPRGARRPLAALRASAGGCRDLAPRRRAVRPAQRGRAASWRCRAASSSGPSPRWRRASPGSWSRDAWTAHRSMPAGSGPPASAPACSRGRASIRRSSSGRCWGSCTPRRLRRRSSCRTPSRTDSRPASTRSTPTTSHSGSTASRPATSTSTAASPARSCSGSRSAAGSARRSEPARRPAGRTTSSDSAAGGPPPARRRRRRCTCAASTPVSRR